MLSLSVISERSQVLPYCQVCPSPVTWSTFWFLFFFFFQKEKIWLSHDLVLDIHFLLAWSWLTALCSFLQWPALWFLSSRQGFTYSWTWCQQKHIIVYTLWGLTSFSKMILRVSPTGYLSIVLSSLLCWAVHCWLWVYVCPALLLMDVCL